MTVEEMREEVCAWAKQSYREKMFAGTSGNLSVYNREQDILVITPSSVPYESITPNDMIVMRLNGDIIEGHYRPSSEWRMHAVIYAEKQDVNAVIHTHSPYATSFAVNNMEIPVILIEMIPFLGGNIQVAKFAWPGTPEVGTEAVKVLKDRNGCLLANHGVLAVGNSLEQAHVRGVYVEDAAKIYSIAKGNGPITLIDPKDIAAMKKR